MRGVSSVPAFLLWQGQRHFSPLVLGHGSASQSEQGRGSGVGASESSWLLFINEYLDFRLKIDEFLQILSCAHPRLTFEESAQVWPLGYPEKVPIG
jgi:hypothetical protein